MRRLLPLLLLFSGCETRPPLPVFGTVPHFELTAQDGHVFNSDVLKDHVWVADFIFTNCPGPCLRMSTLLGRVQRATEKFPDIHLVSFTIDPARDTPSALTAFASKYQADPKRWSFLTGAQPTLQLLSRDAFKFGDVDGTMNHNTRFALIDRKGRIRGYYGTVNDDPVAKWPPTPAGCGRRLIDHAPRSADHQRRPERNGRHPVGMGLHSYPAKKNRPTSPRHAQRVRGYLLSS